MMNKSTLGLIVAFLAGGTAGFLITRKMLEEKYAQLAEDEIAEFKEYHGIGRETTENEYGIPREEIDTEEVRKYTSMNDRLGYSSLRGTRTEAINKQKTQYNIAAVNEDEDEVNPVPEEEDTGVDSPYVITETQFSEERFDHDKVSWTFYAHDSVLADENDEVVDDIDGTVGWGSLDMRNATLDNPHMIYVRNENIDIDYEITINYGAYKQIVAGIPVEALEMAGKSPREQQELRMKKKEAEKQAEEDEEDE